jgi:predicted RNA-binding protein with PUA-like domain
MSRRPKHYWLLKTEPDDFSIDDLRRKGTEGWDGVRNYQARNFLRDEIKRGDGVLIYHSSTSPPGVAGLARVSQGGHPDPSQFRSRSKYYDPSSSKAEPRWFQVEVEFVEKFERLVTLEELKADPACEAMRVIQKGQRLSVQPVEACHYRRVRTLGRRPDRRSTQPAPESASPAKTPKARKCRSS